MRIRPFLLVCPLLPPPLLALRPRGVVWAGSGPFDFPPASGLGPHRHVCLRRLPWGLGRLRRLEPRYPGGGSGSPWRRAGTARRTLAAVLGVVVAGGRMEQGAPTGLCSRLLLPFVTAPLLKELCALGLGGQRANPGLVIESIFGFLFVCFVSPQCIDWARFVCFVNFFCLAWYISMLLAWDGIGWW